MNPRACESCRTRVALAHQLCDDPALHFLIKNFRVFLVGVDPWDQLSGPHIRCPILRPFQNGQVMCRDLIRRIRLSCTSDECFTPTGVNLILFHQLHPCSHHSSFVTTTTKHSGFTAIALQSNSTMSTHSTYQHKPIPHSYGLSGGLSSWLSQHTPVINGCSHLRLRLESKNIGNLTKTTI